MDPVTLSTAFATIVGLLGNYASEARAEKSQNLEGFLSWLQEKHHAEISDLIKSNSQVSVGIKELLQKGQATVIEKLSELDMVLASVALRLNNFGDIAAAVKPKVIISDQAIHLLQELDNSGGSGLIEIKYIGGSTFQVLDGGEINIKISEPRFLEDDLDTLCYFGFLRLDYLSSNRIFRYTRQGAAFVAALPKV